MDSPGITLEPEQDVKLSELEDRLKYHQAPATGFKHDPLVYRYCSLPGARIYAYPQQDALEDTYAVPYFALDAELTKDCNVFIRVGGIVTASTNTEGSTFKSTEHWALLQAVQNRTKPHVWQASVQDELLSREKLLGIDNKKLTPKVWAPNRRAIVWVQVVCVKKDADNNNRVALAMQFDHPDIKFLASFSHARAHNKVKRELTEEQKTEQREKAKKRRQDKKEKTTGSLASIVEYLIEDVTTGNNNRPEEPTVKVEDVD